MEYTGTKKKILDVSLDFIIIAGFRDRSLKNIAVFSATGFNGILGGALFFRKL